MTEATVPLALADLVPVALSAWALTRIAAILEARSPAARRPLGTGVGLVVMGGLVKATGKVVLAVTGRDVVLLNEGLFPLIAPGMAVLAVTTVGLLRRPDRPPSMRSAGAVIVATAIVGTVATVLGSWDLAKPLLIAVASIGNITLFVAFARAAARDGSRRASTLVVASLGVVLALAGMSRTLAPTIANQWIEQTANAIGQGALAAAALAWSRVVLPAGRRDHAAGSVEPVDAVEAVEGEAAPT